MPRQARIDATGILHHVMARGIERKAIFRNDTDREWFLERLGSLAEKTHTSIYAFALIPNHFHLLLRSGPEGLSLFMRRLLTGYAVSFNKRYNRSGHLFQNRYSSVVCEEDPYFMELIRYIHLNPFRARIVNTLEKLDGYPWCSHHYLNRKNPFPWYDAPYVLQWFGNSKKIYRTFIREGVEKKHLPDLSGGGLIRSLGGLTETVRRKNAPVRADERILGTGAFVENILKQKHRYNPVHERTEKMKEIIDSSCKKAGIQAATLQGGIRSRPVSHLRGEIAFVLVRNLGISYAEIGRQLGITTSAVSRIMERRNED